MEERTEGGSAGGASLQSLAKRALPGKIALAGQIAAAKASTDDMMYRMGIRVGEKTMSLSKHLPPEMRQEAEVTVGEELIELVATQENMQSITEESGAEVKWTRGEDFLQLVGNADQLKAAERIVARVRMHCHWGFSSEKVRRILGKRRVESVRCRLSPMSEKLTEAMKTLTSVEPRLSLGKDPKNTVVIKDKNVSRHHCLLSLDQVRGEVYISDLSTNGTYLNGTRIPNKKLGKVLLSHGDEVLLKDPRRDAEFGYICNLEELSVKEEARLDAPRRMLGLEEASFQSAFDAQGRDTVKGPAPMRPRP